MFAAVAGNYLEVVAAGRDCFVAGIHLEADSGSYQETAGFDSFLEAVAVDNLVVVADTPF